MAMADCESDWLAASRSRATLAIAALAIGFSLHSVEAAADSSPVAGQMERSKATYTTPQAWSRRRAELRQRFLEGAGLWPLPERTKMNVLAHSRREHDGYAIENVALETLPGFFCTGNLYRPLGQKVPGPAVLCPHGHFRPLGRYRASQQIRCAHLARMGATVFSVSMVGWQDSQQTTHDDPHVLALQTWNSLRATDYLAGLRDVDADRLGATGASGGGTQTFFLAMLDDRIKASAPVVIVYPWTAPAGCRCEGGLPVMQAARTNAIELAAAVSPRAQLLISVGKDRTRNFPHFGFPFIRHFYELSGHGELVENIHFGGEAHDFGRSKRQAVYSFFAKHLNMDLLPERTASVNVETPETMAVFNEKHPLPRRALRGSKQIAAALEKLRGK